MGGIPFTNDNALARAHGFPDGINFMGPEPGDNVFKAISPKDGSVLGTFTDDDVFKKYWPDQYEAYARKRDSEKKKEKLPSVPTSPNYPHIGLRADRPGKVLSLTPDIKLTPRGDGVVPVAYNIWAPTHEDLLYSPDVLWNSKYAMRSNSAIYETHGGDPGTEGGIKTKTYKYHASPKEHSSAVRINGFYAIRDAHLFYMNGPDGKGNTIGEARHPGDQATRPPPQLTILSTKPLAEPPQSHGVLGQEPQATGALPETASSNPKSTGEGFKDGFTDTAKSMGKGFLSWVGDGIDLALSPDRSELDPEDQRAYDEEVQRFQAPIISGGENFLGTIGLVGEMVGAEPDPNLKPYTDKLVQHSIPDALRAMRENYAKNAAESGPDYAAGHLLGSATAGVAAAEVGGRVVGGVGRTVGRGVESGATKLLESKPVTALTEKIPTNFKFSKVVSSEPAVRILPRKKNKRGGRLNCCKRRKG
ncbi:DUF4150 domain-containing protein [Labrys neptuniae]|uniref:PAAR-like domain-containing protein n=1 Tax=Labrys neptuniae TaxID=376174 RepID=UPI00288F5A29|nr:PAAR-like domain-containing protein [Labrys neptuniae]MDT3381164.1 DUF4150 domain-containing protein [Labrys neptuniae]